MLSPSTPWRIWLAAAALAALALAGCEPAVKIRQYKVPKLAAASASKAHSQTPAVGQPRSTLGAIVLAGPSAWFFKATGDPDAVAKTRGAIVEFVRSVQFSAEGAGPKWKLPDGWKERAGDAFRFATIEVPAAEGVLEMSVSRLPRGQDDADYVLQNVNRWRGQLGLAETTAETLAKEAEQFQIGEFPCTVVELTGTGGGMLSSALFGPLPDNHPPVSAGEGSAAREPQAPRLSYETPEGWQERPLGAFRRASFAVTDGDRQADISVTDLDLRGGDMVENVNRWRQQVNLPPQSAQEVTSALRPIAGQGIEWQWVELVGSEETILGAIGKTDRAAWFVKLKGDSALAEREKSKFETFVKSLKVE
jgi:hypothetical protein